MTAPAFGITAALLLFFAVAMGAFGAHGLKSRLSPEMLSVFHTAVQYHAWHALALLAIATLDLAVGFRASWAAWFYVAGIVLFSGSLYLLAITGVRGLGAITPVGGLCFLAGHAALAWAFWSHSHP